MFFVWTGFFWTTPAGNAEKFEVFQLLLKLFVHMTFHNLKTVTKGTHMCLPWSSHVSYFFHNDFLWLCVFFQFQPEALMKLVQVFHQDADWCVKARCERSMMCPTHIQTSILDTTRRDIQEEKVWNVNSGWVSNSSLALALGGCKKHESKLEHIASRRLFGCCSFCLCPPLVLQPSHAWRASHGLRVDVNPSTWILH